MNRSLILRAFSSSKDSGFPCFREAGSSCDEWPGSVATVSIVGTIKVEGLECNNDMIHHTLVVYSVKTGECKR